MDRPASPRWRRLIGRPRLSVRGLMVLVLLIGGGLGWWVHKAKVRREAVAAISRAGGWVVYEWEDYKTRSGLAIVGGDYWHSWLARRLGPEYVGDVVDVHIDNPERPVDAALLDQVGRLDRVRLLTLVRSGVTDSGLAPLARLSGLEQLDLAGCNALTDIGLAHLRGLNRLRSLELSRTGVQGPGLRSLENLHQLDDLTLSFIPLHDDDLRPLARSKNLKRLRFSSPYLTDAGLIHLAGLTRLEILWLYDRPSGSPISSKGLCHLSGLRNLEILVLVGTQVDDLRPLGRLANLHALWLFGTPIGDEGLESVNQSQFPTLRHLDLPGTKATTAFINGIAVPSGVGAINIDGPDNSSRVLTRPNSVDTSISAPSRQ